MIKIETDFIFSSTTNDATGDVKIFGTNDELHSVLNDIKNLMNKYENESQ